MSLRGVMRNVRNYGVRETLRIRKKNKSIRDIFDELTSAYRERQYDSLSDKEKLIFNTRIKELEKQLHELDPQKHKKYLKEIRAFYLKDVAPAVYSAVCSKPVKDKVVFVEKDIARTAPNSYISDVLKEQGRYEVKMYGLGQRSLTRIEYFEALMDMIADTGDAKAIFISSANEFFSTFDLRPETKLIQLWHGLGIFKKVGYSTLDSKGFGRSETDMIEYDYYRNYSYVTLPSMEQAWIFEDAMHIPVDSGKLVPVGVSRTDRFYDQKFIDTEKERLYERFPAAKGKKIILYAPTYRGTIKGAYGPDQMDLRMMAEELGEDYVLLIKHHGFVKKTPPIPEDLDNTFIYDLNRNPMGVIERTLPVADICITDYSSIGFEYTLLERPIIFYAYDVDEYIDERGMYYDYDEITPGPVCRTTREIADYIKTIDREGFDKSEVTAFKEKFVGNCDGHSTERTIALIES